MTNTDKRIAVIGAGPIGLEAALAGRKSGFDVTVYERGRIGEHVQQWGHVRLFSPFGMNSTPLGRAAIKADFPPHEFPKDTDLITGRQHYSVYLEPLTKTNLLKECIRTETLVLSVGRQRLLKDDLVGDAKRASYPFRLFLREKGKERIAEADVVLDCSGTYGQHRWLGEGGIPAVGEPGHESQIRYSLEDVGERKSVYAGKTTLVFGGGYSAATAVYNLAELAKTNMETWVIWLARTQATQPIRRIMNDPLRERDRLAVEANMLATRGEGNVEFHGQAVVQAVESLGQDKGFRVHALIGKTPRTWEVERLIANVGYRPDNSLYRELQVHEPRGPESVRQPEPNFYILGSKSYGRNSQFLMHNGFDQVREFFGLITGKKDLRL